MKTDSLAMSRRGLLGTLGVITAGVALAGCGSDSSTNGSGGAGGKPVAGGALVLGLPALSDYLNPLVATTNALAWVTDPVVETLYTYDDQMRSVPLLAAGEPTISEDGLTWTIEVAKGVTFSNGEPLTAEDVAAVINHVSDPAAYTDWTSYFAYFVSGAKAKGPRTVVISLAMPYGVLRSHLSNLPIIHRDSLKKNDTTIGTGPYVIDKVTQGQTVLLRRNESYHGTAGGPDTLEYRAIPDAGTRLVNLREGKIHVMTDVPGQQRRHLGEGRLPRRRGRRRPDLDPHLLQRDQGAVRRRPRASGARPRHGPRGRRRAGVRRHRSARAGPGRPGARGARPRPRAVLRDPGRRAGQGAARRGRRRRRGGVHLDHQQLLGGHRQDGRGPGPGLGEGRHHLPPGDHRRRHLGDPVDGGRLPARR